MNLRFLETFVWVARLKSFSAAAAKLHTTQPNISSRVAVLEKDLGVPLYSHGAKDFQLTAAGRRLYEYAEQITDLASQMQRELYSAGDDNAVIRVGIIEMVTLSWLPQFVRAIRASETLIEVDFITETSGSLIQSLRSSDIDIAFIWGPASEPNISNDYLCHYALGWLAHPDFGSGLDSLDVVDIARFPVIPSKKEASGHAVVSEYFAAYGVAAPQKADDRVTLSSYSLATALQLIRTGLGVMALPPLLMAEELRNNAVIMLPVKQPLPPIYLTACYRTHGARPFLTKLVQMARSAASEYAATVDPKHFWM